MRLLYAILLFLFPLLSLAQSGDMRVYTVAGNNINAVLGDGGPATAAGLGSTEGVWIDRNCNLYFSDPAGYSRVRKVNLASGIITSVAGSSAGYSGDGGPATDAKLKGPYGIYVDSSGNVYVAENASPNNRVRKVEANTGKIYTFAGGGSSIIDGIQATNAQLNLPQNVYGDNSGNIYISEKSKIRKISTATGIISTVAGNGSIGLSGDNGPATSAQLNAPAGMLFDASGNLIFADRGNSRIRKINTNTGIITTIAGTTDGFSGDGGPATSAQLSGPISFVIDCFGNIIIGDNQNNLIRKLDAVTGIITAVAGVGPSITGDTSNGALAINAEIHPEFLYLDLEGNIYFSNYGGQIRKITNFNPGLSSAGSNCNVTSVSNVEVNIATEIYPNPANDKLLFKSGTFTNKNLVVLNSLGQIIINHYFTQSYCLDIKEWPVGIYFVTVKDTNHTIMKKIIKSN